MTKPLKEMEGHKTFSSGQESASAAEKREVNSKIKPLHVQQQLSSMSCIPTTRKVKTVGRQATDVALMEKELGQP